MFSSSQSPDDRLNSGDTPKKASQVLAKVSHASHRRKPSGFTLVETMIATVVFAMVMLGVYACIGQAYKLTKKSRYNDQARAILLSYVDQFQRLQLSGTSYRRVLFTPTTAGATGVGLLWPTLSTQETSSGQGTFATIPLDDISGSGTGSTAVAQVTRDVYPVNPTTGAILSAGAADLSYTTAAGYMLIGIFTIKIWFNGSADAAAHPNSPSLQQRLVTVRSSAS